MMTISSAATGAALPNTWQAPVPQDGRVELVADWWNRFDDPLLTRLIIESERVSADLATALARIEQARASHAAAKGATLPMLDGNVDAVRGRQTLIDPAANNANASLQLAWELDVFGRGRARSQRAAADLRGAQLAWHESRVLLAAEVASAYVTYRACEGRVGQLAINTKSREEIARLTDLKVASGTQSPASGELAAASAAQGRVELNQQKLSCDSQVKALVALTAIDEPDLRLALAAKRATLPNPREFSISNIPAEALAQRPDLARAEQSVIAASASTADSKRAQWPRIVFTGQFDQTRMGLSSLDQRGSTWSVGPLAITLPIFDAGVRKANVRAAEAQYQAASSAYAATWRNAIQEVEQTLLRLQSAADQAHDAERAAAGFRAALNATSASYQAGAANLFDLEDARRNDVQAQIALIDLQRERVVAWIALYRALGGGWNDATQP
jgi:NodT family efflux transporter outer membrane factor (OMF) lipoprotein